MGGVGCVDCVGWFERYFLLRRALGVIGSDRPSGDWYGVTCGSALQRDRAFKVCREVSSSSPERPMPPLVLLCHPPVPITSKQSSYGGPGRKLQAHSSLDKAVTRLSLARAYLRDYSVRCAGFFRNNKACESSYFTCLSGLFHARC